MPEEITIKVLLEPHENKYLKDWYRSSNFEFIAGNTKKLCSSDVTCKYELEDGVMAEAFVPSERIINRNIQI